MEIVYPVVKCRCCGECFVLEKPMDKLQPRLGYVIKPDKNVHDCSNMSNIKIDENKYEDFHMLFDIIGSVKAKEGDKKDE
jgi:hypothetical protein